MLGDKDGDMHLLHDTLQDVENVIKEHKPPSQDRVKEIDRRLKFWRNPQVDPNSNLYGVFWPHETRLTFRFKKRKLMHEQEEEEKRVTRLKEEKAAQKQAQDALFAPSNNPAES
jgi:hypothetical protein